MRFQVLFLTTTLLAGLGLMDCDVSTYQNSGGMWTHADAAFTPQDAASFEVASK